MDRNISEYKIHWVRIIYLIIIALFIFFIINQIPSLKDSFKEVKIAKASSYIVIFGVVLLSFGMAALSYMALSFKKLRFSRTLIMQFASNTLNKLLPAGIGAMGANYLYLRRSNLSAISSATTVAINNFLGVMASIILLFILLLSNRSFPIKFSKVDFGTIILLSLAIIIIVIVAFFVRSIHYRLMKLVRSFIRQLASYREHKLRLLGAFMFQLGLAFFNILSLALSMHTVGGNLNILEVMIIYSLAIWFGSLIPAPGGFGSVDAGLVAAFVAYGTSLPQALAVVLVFRLLNFWAPLLIGIPALIYVRAKQYI